VTTAPLLTGGPGSFERQIGDHDFARFQALVHREIGIYLGETKRCLLVGRLSRRLRDLGLGSFAEYYAQVESDPEERIRMFDAISTNETRFFREPAHFQLLKEQILPRWRSEADEGRRPRSLRVWSAASSTGEEAYSLAMTLLRSFPAGAGWEIEILGTDISTRVLDVARQAIWPLERSREIPEADLKSFMLRGFGPEEGMMKAGPEIRSLVHFHRLNLMDDVYPGIGEIDLLFCRNVLIYFDAPTKEAVVSRLLRHLAPSGYLFLGHAESLSSMAVPVRSVVATVYAKSGSGTAARSRT